MAIPKPENPDHPTAQAGVFNEQEAAAVLKMTPRMLATRRYAGKIGAIKDGHNITYTWEHLIEYQRKFQRKVNVEKMDTDSLLRALRKKLSDRP